ncbi:MAG: XTP/dITP diphosphatase [Candidatus Thermoplasmatota archaeon]|nr:XTP/dITP diphosphatase [Candidatus Thermoplasmatota archaeon]
MRDMIRIVTTNPGKLKEIKRYMDTLELEVGLQESMFIEVQAGTLEEVVQYGLDQLAPTIEDGVSLIKDDSGLFIDALSGFPGVYSAYVQRTISNEGILKLMEGVKDRGAVFRTVIGYRMKNGGTGLFRGECRGAISREIRGRQGFGFDPIFIPEGKSITFAEMSLKEKNSMSHRINALKKLVAFLSSR